MKYLGIDYGSKRVGIATSDEGGSFAFPKETMERDANTAERIADMVQELGIERIVMGLPETASGITNAVEADIHALSDEIAAMAQVPIVFQNEQFSSVEASRYAPDARKDDAVSAAIILQRYLDAHPETA